MLRLAEILHDQRHLFRRVRLGLAGHTAGLQCFVEVTALADPEPQVAQCPLGCLCVGKVEHRQFRLPVTADLEWLDGTAVCPVNQLQ